MQSRVGLTLIIGILSAIGFNSRRAAAADPSPTPAKKTLTKNGGSREEYLKRRAEENNLIKGRKELEIVYATADGVPLKLDLYFPENRSEQAMPIVVYVHGGGWKGGTKTGGGWISDVANELIGRGYVVGSIEYRLYPAVQWPNFIYDVKAGVRFLRANAAKYGIDPTRIGAWGGSAGGHLVSLLGTTDSNDKLEGDLGNSDQSSRVQAVVDMFGPSDFSLAPHEPTALIQQLGSFDNYKAASPVTYVTKDDAPCLIIQGDSDTLVPQIQSERLHETLKAAGVESTMIIVKNGKHGLNTPNIKPTKVQLVKMMGDFYDKHLGKPAEKPAPAK